MAETYIVKSKVADLVRGMNMMMAADSYDELNSLVMKRMNQAIERCKANGRKTVKGADF